jgi:hypothetical protein
MRKKNRVPKDAVANDSERVRCGGGWVAWIMIFSFLASEIEAFGPRPLLAGGDRRRGSKTIRARAPMHCGLVEAMIIRSSSLRCPPSTSKTSIGRPTPGTKAAESSFVTSLTRHYTKLLQVAARHPAVDDSYVLQGFFEALRLRGCGLSLTFGFAASISCLL